jgi:hypothetical protein
VDGGQAFTAGILHDIGKVVISAGMEGKALELAKSVLTGQDHASYLSAEHDALGVDHCEAGEALALEWRLPECYRIAIRHHHDPAVVDELNATLVFATHLGDTFAMMSGAGTGADSLLYPLCQDYVRYFDIPPEGVQRILLAITDEYGKLTHTDPEEEGVCHQR